MWAVAHLAALDFWCDKPEYSGKRTYGVGVGLRVYAHALLTLSSSCRWRATTQGA